MNKKIIITETQEKILLESMICEKTYPINNDKVLQVKEFLDSFFKRGKITEFGEDGLPVDKPVAGLVYNKKIIKNYTAQQLLDLLEYKFDVMFSDKTERRKLLSKIIVDWYNKQISNDGLLSVTHC